MRFSHIKACALTLSKREPTIGFSARQSELSAWRLPNPTSSPTHLNLDSIPLNYYHTNGCKQRLLILKDLFI